MLFYFIQATVYASESGVLTEEMIDARVTDALRAHEKKVTWQAEQEETAAFDTRGRFKTDKDMTAFTPPNGALSS